MSKASLTPKQKAQIDRILETYPSIEPEHVNGYYVPSYMYAWKIMIETPEITFFSKVRLTHCDHKTTAIAKAQAYRDYITARKAGQS